MFKTDRRRGLRTQNCNAGATDENDDLVRAPRGARGRVRAGAAPDGAGRRSEQIEAYLKAGGSLLVGVEWGAEVECYHPPTSRRATVRVPAESLPKGSDRRCILAAIIWWNLIPRN